MTLPPFQVHRPISVEEATALVDEHGDNAALYCGGTELLLLMKLGFAQYGHLINVKHMSQLQGIRAENRMLHIGAAVTHR